MFWPVSDKRRNETCEHEIDNEWSWLEHQKCKILSDSVVTTGKPIHQFQDSFSVDRTGKVSSFNRQQGWWKSRMIDRIDEPFDCTLICCLLTWVGIVDLVDFIRVQPHLALTALEDRGREALLQTEGDHLISSINHWIGTGQQSLTSHDWQEITTIARIHMAGWLGKWSTE